MSRPTQTCSRYNMIKYLFKRIMIDIDYYHKFLTSFTNIKPHIENDIILPRAALLIPKMYDHVYQTVKGYDNIKLSMIKALSALMFKDRVDASDMSIYSELNNFIERVRNDVNTTYSYICDKYNAHMVTDHESIQYVIDDKYVIPMFTQTISRFEIYTSVGCILVHMCRSTSDVRNAWNDDLTKWASFLYVLLSNLKNILFYLTNDTYGSILVSRSIRQPISAYEVFAAIDTDYLKINDILYVSYNSTTVLTTNETYVYPSWLVSVPRTLTT